MQIIICPICGNTENFYEKMFIIQYKYFHQREDGQIEKVDIQQNNMPDHDSRIYCSNCGQEIDEDYGLFLDRYSETIFDKT